MTRTTRTSPVYFSLVAVIHLAAIATRFDQLAARLPPSASLAILLAQCPLLVLSGYFESRIDHSGPSGMPRWMQIDSRPIKLAFTFGFIYLACVTLQTWHISIGPIDPTPPLAFPPAQRALWFTMFTVGFFFPFYLAATSLLIPVLRVITLPLRPLPTALGALGALALGGGLGVLLISLVTSTRLRDFIDRIHDAIDADPVLTVGITLAMIFVPMLIGLIFRRDEESPR